MEERTEVGEALDLESSGLFLGLRSRRVVGPYKIQSRERRLGGQAQDDSQG